MDTQKLGLGQIITTEHHRDAIHVAIAPVIAFHSLSPGEHVGINEEGKADNLTENTVGVVDPFLKARVMRGERFWLFLYPGSITSLRHEWEHPAFMAREKIQTEKEKAEEWLQDMAMRCGVSYDRMMDAIAGGNYINMGENEGYKDVFKSELAGKYASIVLGREIKDPYPFSCSC